MGVNITTIIYIRVLIIQIGSTIILMVVEAQGIYIYIFMPTKLLCAGCRYAGCSKKQPL